MLCCGCGVGQQLQLRFNPLAWEFPYAKDVILKKKRKVWDRTLWLHLFFFLEFPLWCNWIGGVFELLKCRFESPAGHRGLRNSIGLGDMEQKRKIKTFLFFNWIIFETIKNLIKKLERSCKECRYLRSQSLWYVFPPNTDISSCNHIKTVKWKMNTTTPETPMRVSPIVLYTKQDPAQNHILYLDVKSY